MTRVNANRRRILLAGALLPLVVLVGVFTWNRSTPKPQISSPPPSADVTLDRFHHQASKGGRIQWEINADSADYFKTGERANLTGIHARFYPENGKTIHVNAETGGYVMSEDSLSLTGNVRVRQEGLQLISQHIEYREATETLHSPGITRIKGKGLDFTARSATFSVPDDRLTLSGGVEGTLEDPDIQ